MPTNTAPVTTVGTNHLSFSPARFTCRVEARTAVSVRLDIPRVMTAVIALASAGQPKAVHVTAMSPAEAAAGRSHWKGSQHEVFRYTLAFPVHLIDSEPRCSLFIRPAYVIDGCSSLCNRQTCIPFQSCDEFHFPFLWPVTVSFRACWRTAAQAVLIASSPCGGWTAFTGMEHRPEGSRHYMPVKEFWRPGVQRVDRCWSDHCAELKSSTAWGCHDSPLEAHT